jgi:hypothetical protein
LGIAGLRGINMLECVPLMDWLIINDDVRLRQEANETITDAQLISGRARIVSAARTPQIKIYTIGFEPTHFSHDAGHGDSFRPHGTNQGVINIHEYDVRFHAARPG